MKIKLEIKNRFTGKIIFEYEKENNTIKDTLLEAIKNGANLVRANLYGANLYGANLYGANLYGANLYGANLVRANLYGANLYGANLDGANLDGANLDGANLYGANLYGANLYGANLDGANLVRANLYGANLYGANLYGANLDGANLDLEKLPNKHLFQTLPEGSIIGWKKAQGKIIKLLIPIEAKRVHGIGHRKCRAEFAKVLEIEGGLLKLDHIAYNHKTTYEVGEIVKPDKFTDNILIECGHGINFFITKQEAIDY